MNRKIIICLLVLIVLAVPIVIFASNKLETPIYVEPSDEEIEQILISRKQQFLKDFENGAIDTPITYSSISSSEIEENEKIQVESKEEENLISSIINKFYPTELNIILQKMNNENMIYYNSVSETQKELYRLVLDILENEKLVEEETNILKEFLRSVYSNIKNDLQLQVRFEAIL